MLLKIAELEVRLRDARWAIEKAEAMLEALTWDRPPGFKIKLDVTGHFSSSPTYNQTESKELNDAFSVVFREGLSTNLVAAIKILKDQEAALARELLQAAVDFTTSPPPTRTPRQSP